MRAKRGVAVLVLAIGLAGCGSKFKTYDGPEVTRVVVMKEQRQMYLMNEDRVLTQHEFELGFAPTGHKEREGDGRTPEGRYFIDRRNPNSEYHLSIGISYPNASDIAEAEAKGVSPGGDIFIHGTPRRFRRAGDDWTAGCIAISNSEMEDVYAMVRDGTPVDIFR